VAKVKALSGALLVFILSMGWMTSAAELPQPSASLLARIGDPAPGVARVRGPWNGGLAFTGAGGVLYSDSSYSALYLTEDGETRVLLHIGDSLGDRGTVSAIQDVAAGGGAIAALVSVIGATPGPAIVRVDPAGGVQGVEFGAGDTLPLRDGPAIVGSILGVSVDGAGRVVAAVTSPAIPPDTGRSAIVRRPPGGPDEILVQSGDPVGSSTFAIPLTQPGVNAAGDIAFDTRTAAGTHVLARRSSTGAVATFFEGPASPCPPGAFCPPAPLGVASPAINGVGDIAFLWSSAGAIRAQRIAGGLSEAVAEPGSAAPGGDTFTDITALPPAIDEAGGVVFAAHRSGGIGGIYHAAAQVEVVAEEGSDAGEGRQFAFFYVGGNQSSPAVAPDGTIAFVAADTDGDAVFARTGAIVRVVAREGDPVTGPARFVSLFESLLPNLSAGPSMAGNADVIFDARITGGRRGLYARRLGGPVRAVALDGDAAPGGGRFDGDFMTFHSINSEGLVAFLDATTGIGTGSSLALFTGPGGGPLQRVVGVGDPVPGSTALLSGFLPPSGINAAGAVALPVALADGTSVLLGWDGASLLRVAGTGDVIPGEGAIVQLRLSPLLPPVLDDAGTVLFTAITEAGGAGLYEAPLVEGGYGAARRVLGAGDFVQGGVLDPFRLRMMSRDAAGRLAFQAAPMPGISFGTYTTPPRLPASIIATGDSIPGGGTVTDVLPHLAAGDEGVVHEVSGAGYVLLLAVPPSADDPGAGFNELTLVRPGMPSPDGGTYAPWARAGLIGGLPSIPDRLAANGGRYAALLTFTTVAPQELVLLDLRPNRAPVADAGLDQTIECAGLEGATVTLDGTASADPEGGPLEYEWTGPFGVATGPQPTVTMPLGAWVVTLTVRDDEGAVATDTVTITVGDHGAPTITASATPATLWPPDGRLRDIAVTLTVSDVCDPNPHVVLASIAIADVKGSDPASDVAGASYGAFDIGFQLRARRSGSGPRTYTITYRATDASGNSTQVSTTVVVPQSQGQ
jgi:PKD domain-containing protein